MVIKVCTGEPRRFIQILVAGDWYAAKGTRYVYRVANPKLIRSGVDIDGLEVTHLFQAGREIWTMPGLKRALLKAGPIGLYEADPDKEETR